MNSTSPASARVLLGTNQPEIVRAVHAAKLLVSTSPRQIELHLWQENDASGRPLTDPIFEHIANSDIFVADITATNFNVTFEIGYAIGNGKRVSLTRNNNFKRDNNLIDSIGIFDTLGYEIYSDEIGLASLITITKSPRAYLFAYSPTRRLQFTCFKRLNLAHQ